MNQFFQEVPIKICTEILATFCPKHERLTMQYYLLTIAMLFIEYFFKFQAEIVIFSKSNKYEILRKFHFCTIFTTKPALESLRIIFCENISYKQF